MARMKKPTDPNGRHIRVYCSLLNTPAWRCLGWPARSLFIDMRSTLGATNNGNISAALSDLKHRGWSSSKTLASALYELRALGFIAVTREGGLRQGSRVPTLYRFADIEVYEQLKVGVQPCKATYEYLQYDSVAKAMHALQDGVKHLRDVGRKKQFPKNLPVPKGNPIGSVSEAIAPFIASPRKQGRRSSVPKGNREIST